MKSKKIKIQTILMKGTIVFLILTMLSSFLPIISVFAEEIDETTTGSGESTNGNIIDEESDYILSEDAEHITGVIIDEIDKLKEQLQDIDEKFDYTKFIEKIALQPVIEISNELELRALSIYVAEGHDCAGKTFRLKRNIVLTDTIEWNPIGDSTTEFKGTINGAGYTVSGMLISIKQTYAGFVGFLGTGGTIKNLTIANSKISILPEVDNAIQNDLTDYKTVGYSNLGAIAGKAVNATISNCKNTTNLSGGNIVGGIVGRAEDTTVEYCSNSGKVQAYRTAGGIVGSYNTTKEGTNINNCINNGEVYAIAEGAGGISGTAWNKSVIKNCINNGSVYTAKDKLTIYVYGEKTTVTPQNAGGITSAIAFDKDNAGTVKIENCVNNGKVDGYKDIGGLIGQAGNGSYDNKSIQITKCINAYKEFNNSDKVSDEYASKIGRNIGEFIGYVGVSNVPVTITDCYITTEVEDSDSPNLTDYLTKENEKIRAFGKLGGTKCTKTDCKETNHPYEHIKITPWTKETGEGDKKQTITNLFYATTQTKINEITDTVAPQIVEETIEGTEEKVKKATITNNGNSQDFAIKGDVLTITIPFDEPIRINRVYPNLYLNEVAGIEAEYKGIGDNSLIFKYQVTGKEGTSSVDLTKVVLSGYIYDAFENKNELRSENIELDKDVKIVSTISTDTENIQKPSVSYSKDDILYTISGFSKTTEDGKLYFNKNSNITITVEFSGPLTHEGDIATDLKSDMPKLHILQKGASQNNEWCVIDNGNYVINENKIVYTFKAGDKATNKQLELDSLYLTTETKVEIGGEDFGKFTKESTGVQVNNIYVDTIAPKLTMTTVVNNKTDNNRYTVGEDILIKVTTDETIDVKNSVRPEINVSFSESGLGKYNAQEDSTKTGNAKYMETIANEDGTVTYKYRYTVQDGDEGKLKLDCISNEVYDIAGNTAIKTEVTYNTDNMYVDTTAPTVQIKTLANLGDKYDFNGDSITDFEDAKLIQKYLKGTLDDEEIKQKIEQKGDADGDGYISVTDATEIQLKLTSDIKNTNEENLTYLFEFSETVEGFTEEDITVNNGIKGEFKEVEEGTEYTLEVESLTTDGNEGVLQVIVESDTCKDLVGYGNIRQESNITIDKVRPTFTSYEIKEESGRIIIEAIFSEALSDASKLIPTITVDGKDGRGTWEKAEIYDNNKVRFVYNIAGADGGKVEASLEGIVTDIAGNNSEKLNIQLENNIILEQEVIKDNSGNEYSFKKNNEPILDFSKPTYFIKDDEITVIKTTIKEDGETDYTEYEYTIDKSVNQNLYHIFYMTLTDPKEGENLGTVTFSQGNGSINITEANIWFDTIAPTITLSAKAENELESGVYAEGTKIIVEAKTSEAIVNKENIPQVNVKFSDSGLGKYNYQGENSTTGNAKYIETIENEDGSISWKYEYIVQNGDEGSLSLEYANQGEIEDLAGNKTKLEEYPEVSIGEIVLSDRTISGKETKISYEIYKNNSKIKNFKKNTYFTDGDTIKVIAKFNNVLNTEYGSTNTYVSIETAPKLEIDGKVFEANRIIGNKEIEYIYEVNGDSNEKLDILKLTTTRTLHAKKSDNTYEPISGKLSEINIENCNLHIYNAGTEIIDSNINVDTTAPTVKISVIENLGNKYDVDGDSITDAADLILIQKYLDEELKDETIKQAIKNKCDVNGNGNVDIIDVTSIERLLTNEIKITNKDKLIYTFNFSEEVEGFTIEDITVNNGTKGELKEILSGKEYTLDVTTSIEKGNVGDIQVIVEKNACQDKVGLSNVRTESVIRVDKRAPILIGLEAYATSNTSLNGDVDTVKQYYKVGDTVTVVATFDESIKENTTEVPTLALQFSESGNAKGNVSEGIIEGNKITYTYTITEEDKGTLSVKGFSGKVIDAAGNETIVTKRELTGDTIIADSIAPELVGITAIAPNFKYDNLLSNEGETKRYGIGETITFVAEYSENVYNLTSNTIKVIDEETAPSLKIKFGTTERTATFDKDKTEGNKIYYTYTITSGDNGNLNISSLTGTVSDIVGNTLDISKADLSEVNKAKYEESISEENKVEVITADTRKPSITFNASAIDYDDNGNEITGNGHYYRKGSVITIVAEADEYVYNNIDSKLEKFTNSTAPTLNISFSTSGSGRGTVENVEYKEGKTIFTYTYMVKENDNGTLSVNINESLVSDIALNENMYSSMSFNTIISDTIAPYIAENTNGISQWEISSTSTSITATGIFTEQLYVMDEDNNLTKLSAPADAPVMGIFADGQMKGTAQASISTVEGKTKLTYTYNTSQIDAEKISVNIIDKTLYDIAGNEWSLDINADTSSPKFYNIQVLTENGYYNKGDKLEIIARFYEVTKLTQAPKLKISIGEEIIEIEGTIDVNDELNTERIKTVRYSYTVDDENGPLNIVSLIGTAHDGTRGNEINKVYKSDDENVILADNKEILDFNNAKYINNENAKVVVDTTAPTLTITSDVEETNKDVVTYTFKWSEPVYGFKQDDIEVINGLKGTFDGEDEDTIYTLTVDTTNEGRQIVKVNSGVCEDRAGNENTERKTYNKVEIDYTKPIVRAKVNGGNFVIDTDTQKSTLKETIVVNEELSKFEYAWDYRRGIDYITNWKTIDVNDIILNSDINLSTEAGDDNNYYLYLKVTDKAGNELKTRTNAFKVSESAITFEGIPENPTNEDVTVTVKYGEGLTENRKAGISGKTQSADSTKVILSENGTVYAEATDEAGNKVYARQEVNNIDKTAPTAEIAYTENEDGSVTATITLSDGIVTNNNGETTYIFKENGEFTFEFEDDLGNKATATAKVTTIKEVEVPVEEDKEAPTIIFSYTLTNNTVGNSIGATIITDEEAKISYSWDNENWTTTENYVTSVNAVMLPTEEGTYILYAKATDKAGNTSDVKTLEFIVVNSEEETKNPEIIFEDLTILQVDGVKYVKVSADMTMDYITGKMDKEALCGKTPEYIKLTEDKKLRTGSEITLDGETKYVIIVNGDVDCDGEIKPIDVTLANRIRLDKVSSEVIQKIAADFDLNGKVEAIDITMINRYRLGKIKGI